jgi:hypothetical protein
MHLGWVRYHQTEFRDVNTASNARLRELVMIQMPSLFNEVVQHIEKVCVVILIPAAALLNTVET